jgi:hypothetical protein
MPFSPILTLKGRRKQPLDRPGGMATAFWVAMWAIYPREAGHCGPTRSPKAYFGSEKALPLSRADRTDSQRNRNCDLF